MKEAILKQMIRRAILVCQDGYGDDAQACRVAWDQVEELRIALIRKNDKKPPPPKKDPTDPNPLSIREYDI